MSETISLYELNKSIVSLASALVIVIPIFMTQIGQVNDHLEEAANRFIRAKNFSSALVTYLFILDSLMILQAITICLINIYYNDDCKNVPDYKLWIAGPTCFVIFLALLGNIKVPGNIYNTKTYLVAFGPSWNFMRATFLTKLQYLTMAFPLYLVFSCDDFNYHLTVYLVTTCLVVITLMISDMLCTSKPNLKCFEESDKVDMFLQNKILSQFERFSELINFSNDTLKKITVHPSDMESVVRQRTRLQKTFDPLGDLLDPSRSPKGTKNATPEKSSVPPILLKGTNAWLETAFGGLPSNIKTGDYDQYDRILNFINILRRSCVLQNCVLFNRIWKWIHSKFTWADSVWIFIETYTSSRVSELIEKILQRLKQRLLQDKNYIFAASALIEADDAFTKIDADLTLFAQSIKGLLVEHEMNATMSKVSSSDTGSFFKKLARYLLGRREQ